MTESSFKVTLKATNTKSTEVEVTFQTTVEDLKNVVSEKFDHPFEFIKLVYKGKIVDNTDSIGSLNIKEPTVFMVVLKQAEKKSVQSQGINPNLSNIQTGLGDFNPGGFGNFGLINQPGYMSALSSVASPEKMQQMMDDPFYQKMVEQMMSDPQIMMKAMESSPQLKQMVDSNPMMKMMMSNPQLLKAIMTPQNMKMAMQMKKQGGTGSQLGGNQGFNLGQGLGGLGGAGGLGNFGGLGMSNPFGLGGLGGFNNPFLGQNQSSPTATATTNSNTNLNNNQQTDSQPQQNNLFSNPFMNPYANPYAMNPYMNPYMMNPYMNPLMNQMFANQNLNNSSILSNSTTSNPTQSSQQKYKNQLKQLQQMGFTDKTKCISALEKGSGDVFAAIQHLEQ